MKHQKLWDNYWKRRKRKPTIHKKQFKKMKKTIGNLKGKKVLEVGAGTGLDSLYLAKKYKTIPYCIDFSDESIKRIKENFRKENIKYRVVKADIRHIPFPSNYFDVVFSNGVLEHFKNPIKILKEQKRILKNNGLLVVGVPYTFTFLTIKKKLLMLVGRWECRWETQFTRSSLLSLIKKNKHEMCGYLSGLSS